MADTDFGPPWTTLKVLRWMTDYFESKAPTDSPRLDAELLLAHVLDMERVKLYALFDRPMDPDELGQLKALLKRRVAGEPVAYLTGNRGFWSIDLDCDPRALIPRPDTEVLVEEALELIAPDSQARVVDVGTGTGAIALAIAHDRPSAQIVATDASAEALALARHNAQKLGLDDRVGFVEADLLDGVDPDWLPADLIVSNPPYVAESERGQVDQAVLDYEPAAALFAGLDGLDVLRRLVPQATAHLKPGGWLLCEIGYRQGEAVGQLFADAGLVDVRVRQDYGGHDRVVVGRRS